MTIPLTSTSDLMNAYLPMFDSSINTDAAGQTPSRSNLGSSSPSHHHRPDAETPASDQCTSNSISLTSGAPSTTHSGISSQQTTSSLQPSPPYITNHTHPVQSQLTFVPRFNPSATGLSTCKKLTRLLTMQEKENLICLDKLKYFLANAPSQWPAPGSTNQNNSFPNSSGSLHPNMSRFLLPSSEYVTCVSWNNHYYITGTDIVRALVFRFEAFGRPVKNMKKFEEGIFSDLRNLKPGFHACLEEPKSPFLDLLFKYQCIRTQKKQKVFNWFSVPHDRLFLDALERDLKRENADVEPTTVIVGEPALSFTYEPLRSLYEQFGKANIVIEADGDAIRNIGVPQMNRRHDSFGSVLTVSRAAAVHNSDSRELHLHDSRINGGGASYLPSALHDPNMVFLPHSILEGSPTYKQRRKRSANRTDAATRSSSEESNHAHANTSDISVGYGPGDSGMTAADMFFSQVRGEQDVGVRRRKAVPGRGDSNWSSASQLAPGQSSGQDGSVSRFGQSLTNALQPNLPFSEDSLLFAHHSDTHGYSNVGKALTTKVFVCPLFSCGRLFKRMEHLKRHMRTHTMERPFECHHCKKCFSRSDNLSQHLRIHARAEGADTPSDEVVAFDAGMENDGTEEGNDAFFAALSFTEGGLNDLKTCEVELSGQVQDVQGDEEGLVAVPGVSNGMDTDTTSDCGLGDTYFSHTATGMHFGSSEMDCQWAITDSPVMNATCNGEPVMASLTGSSHRQEFTVGSMPLSVATSLEIGPHARHRSATPSIIRSRSASSNRSRSYHPYSRTSSSHSSPATLLQSLNVSSYSMSSDMTLPRSFSMPSLGQGALDIGNMNLDMFSGSMSYFPEPDHFELSPQYPGFESN